MLKAVPESWLSWEFAAMDDGSTVAEFDLNPAGETGTLKIGGDIYTMRRELGLGALVIELQGSALAQAQEPNTLFRAFDIDLPDRRLTLEADAPLLRKYIIRDDGNIIGTVHPESPFSRTARIELPDYLSLPIKLFITWLVMILWRRAQTAEA